MEEQTQLEDAPAVDEVAEETPAEPAKSTTAPRAKRSDIAELQSKFDRREAELNKQSKVDREARLEAEAEVESLRSHLDITRKSANISDNEDTRNREFSEWTRGLSAREASVHQHERRVTMAHLSQVHGIPAEDLEPFETPLEMENAALKWQMNHREEPAAEAVEDEPEEKPESAEDDADDAPSRSNFDMGDGSGKTKNVKDMTDDEFEKDLASRKARARNDMIRRR